MGRLVWSGTRSEDFFHQDEVLNHVHRRTELDGLFQFPLGGLAVPKCFLGFVRHAEQGCSLATGGEPVVTAR
jgi:hypothetical protein